MIDPQQPELTGFRVALANFDGPFDLLLQLIHSHKLDITEIALAEVTDEFIAYTRGLSQSAEDLDEVTEFLLVASTLLDLKAARLVPRGEVDDEADLELLESRDLLFARLLQYRAYKQVSLLFREQMTAAGMRIPRTPELEEKFRDILPPLEFTATPEVIAALYATAISRDHTPPTVAVDHLHLEHVSVAEQRSVILGELASRGRIDFAELAAGAETTLVVVARFLALLELFKAHLCDLHQDTPLGPLSVVAAASGEELRSADLGESEQDEESDRED